LRQNTGVFVTNPTLIIWRKTMSYPRLYRCAGGTTAFCVLLMMMCVGSGVVWGQALDDALENFLQGFQNEFFQSQGQDQKMLEYLQFAQQLTNDNARTYQARVKERVDALGANSTADDERRIRITISVNDNYAIQKLLTDKGKELFTDAPKMQQRLFQMKESVMQRLESLSDIDDIKYVSNRSDGPDILEPFPDFLELTPEQIELIKEQQIETSLKLALLRTIPASEQSEQSRKMAELEKKRMTDVSSSEEWNEISRQMSKILMDRVKENSPQMKKVLIEGRESYMRVLTDAQKAKIKAVMADMPDYMKNLFAAIDREGGGLSILHNWQPGMGVPGVNPNREAPRQRTNTGGRTFPGN